MSRRRAIIGRGGGKALSTVGEILAGAEAALAAGDSATAEALARHVMAACPQHVGAHWALARAALAEGHTSAARRLLCQVLSAAPAHVGARLALARLREADGDAEGALREALIAREDAPDDPDAAAMVERLAGARIADLWPSRGWLARHYLRHAHYHRAATDVAALLAADPTRFDLRVIEGLALWRMGERTLTLAAVERLLDDAPDCLPGLLLRAAILDERGDLGAADLWARARALDPDDEWARATFAADELPLPPAGEPIELPPPPVPLPRPAPAPSREETNLRRLREAVERGECGPASRIELAGLLAHRGEVAVALVHFRAALRDPATDLAALADGLAVLAEAHDAPAAWRLLGDVYLRRGDLARAGAAYERGA